MIFVVFAAGDESAVAARSTRVFLIFPDLQERGVCGRSD
jgi:hypothetical protein